MASKQTTRRRAPRVVTKLEGRLATRVPHVVTVVDLSATGCLIRCDTRLDHGAILDLEVRLGAEPMGVKVRVAEAYQDGERAEGDPGRYLAGLEFLGLPAREVTRLRRFLDEETRRRRNADARPD